MNETPRRRYRRSGVYSAIRLVESRGLRAVDRRTRGGRELAAWVAGLEADLGGADSLSVAERTLIDEAGRTALLVAATDHALSELGSRIVDKKRRSLVRLVEDRTRLSRHLGETLKTLGLKRKAKPVPSFVDLVRQEQGGANASAG